MKRRLAKEEQERTSAETQKATVEAERIAAAVEKDRLTTVEATKAEVEKATPKSELSTTDLGVAPSVQEVPSTRQPKRLVAPRTSPNRLSEQQMPRNKPKGPTVLP